MLEEILALNARAAASGNYEVAYHLLMAALHHADHAGDEAALARLSKIAKKQGDAVEAVQPAHHLCRRHAEARGQTALFDSFQAHIDAVRLRLQSARHLKAR
jgi:hypothetical protein